MSGSDIHEVDVILAGETQPKKVGMRYENMRVHLYVLDAPDAVKLARPFDDARPAVPPFLLIDLIAGIRDRYFHTWDVGALEWHVRAGHQQATVTVDELGADALRVHISNHSISHARPEPLGDYQSDAFGEFAPPVRERERAPPMPAATYFSQGTPDGEKFVFKLHENFDASQNEVVFVDAAKFLLLLAASNPEQAPTQERLESIRESGRVSKWTCAPGDLLGVNCHRLNSGRHQLIFGISGIADLHDAIQASGATTFPVSVRREEAPLLRKLCGAAFETPDPSPYSGPRPSRGRSP